MWNPARFFQDIYRKIHQDQQLPTILPGLDEADINNIKVHDIQNVSYNQSYLQGYYFESKTY